MSEPKIKLTYVIQPKKNLRITGVLSDQNHKDYCVLNDQPPDELVYAVGTKKCEE